MATQVVVHRQILPSLIPSPEFSFPQGRRPNSLPPTLSFQEPTRRESESSRLKREEFQERVMALLPMVKRVAMQMRERLPLHVEVDDLISSGVLGLVDAIQKYDATKQVRLEQYAMHRIRGAILDGLRALDSASRDMRKKNKKAEQVYQRLEAKLGRPPSDLEMAGGLGLSLRQWYRTVRELRAVGLEWLRPLGSVGIKETRATNEEQVAAEGQGEQFEACYRRERRELFDRALARIPEREGRVVQLYYEQELTMREIGERLGIDESRVSQLHSAALMRLRKRIREFIQYPLPAVPRMAW